MTLDPPPSPTGKPRLPPSVVPWLQLLYPVLTVVAAAIALPGPWTAERSFLLATNVVGTLLGMSSAGNRKR